MHQSLRHITLLWIISISPLYAMDSSQERHVCTAANSQQIAVGTVAPGQHIVRSASDMPQNYQPNMVLIFPPATTTINQQFSLRQQANQETEANTITSVITENTTSSSQQMHAEQHQDGNKTPSTDSSSWFSFLGDTYTTLWHHRYITCAALYVSMYTALRCANRYVYCKNVWGAWRAEIPLNRLRCMDIMPLRTELITAIQHAYINPNAPTDPMYPMTCYLKEIAKEERFLRWYLAIAPHLSRWWFGLILPIKQKTIRLARQRLARTLFMKEMFLAWTVDQKMNRLRELKLT